MRVAYQGDPGAYSEAAAHEHFGADVITVPSQSFEAVFESIEAKRCDAGIIPIENSLAGSIHRNYDLLIQHSLHIIGEHYLRIRHCLIALPGVTLAEIRRVISHPQGLAQCDQYLRAMQGIAIEPVYDTAGAVKMIRERGERDVAAVASRRAAEVYEMAILDEGIEDNPANFTRFLAIGSQPVSAPQEAKTSIVFSLRNQPGTLFKALSVFALRDIDLTKIESRPLIGKPWEYLFYIDFLGSTGEEAVKRALDNLSEYALTLRVLGCYPRHQFNLA